MGGKVLVMEIDKVKAAAIEDGMEKGETKMGDLIQNFLGEGRTADAAKAACDVRARKKFYQEFGIN